MGNSTIEQIFTEPRTSRGVGTKRLSPVFQISYDRLVVAPSSCPQRGRPEFSALLFTPEVANEDDSCEEYSNRDEGSVSRILRWSALSRLVEKELSKRGSLEMAAICSVDHSSMEVKEKKKVIDRYASKTTGAGAGLGIPVIPVPLDSREDAYVPPPRPSRPRRSRRPLRSRVTKPRYNIKEDPAVRMGRSKIAKETRMRAKKSSSEESSEQIPLRGRAKAGPKSGAPRKKRGSSAESDYDPKKDRAAAKRKTVKKKS
uniref:Uncharacterized protein n=1 Tax=Steinernema glaseri TaxID=37863 RepID=A0A1I8AVM7_9BILA